MAFRLFKQLRRDTDDLSPQLRSNLDTMADRVRFREFRRTQGRPGITGPFGFVAGQTAPIPSQIAAGRISSRLGTDVGSELNRLTAPDPESFARGARAPEFIGQELELGRTGITEAELANRGTEIDLGFRAPQLQQRLDVGQLGIRTGEQELLGAEAEATRREQLFEPELEVAQQAPRFGELDIAAAEREAAGAPLPEDIRAREAEDRAFEVQQRQREVTTADQQRLLERIDSEIETARLEGDFEKVERLEREARDIQSGFVGPRAPADTFGGAPPATRGGASPVQIERSAKRAISTGTATGLLDGEGNFTLLDDIADEQGFPTRNTLSDLETALGSISNALSLASDVGAPPTARDILITKIKVSEGYRAVKQRAGSSLLRAGVGMITPFAGPRMALGNLRPQDLRGAQQLAQEIVDVVEGPTATGGAPPIR